MQLGIEFTEGIFFVKECRTNDHVSRASTRHGTAHQCTRRVGANSDLSKHSFRIAMRSYQPTVKTSYGRCPKRRRWDKAMSTRDRKRQRRRVVAAV